jgi:hypothetical protein
MAIAGLGWLTYLSNSIVKYLSPYNLTADPPRGSSGIPLAARDVRERSTMEGAGELGGERQS